MKRYATKKDVDMWYKANELSNNQQRPPEIVYSQKKTPCPKCGEYKIVIVFFKYDNINEIIQLADRKKIQLIPSEKKNESQMWLCKNCYDVGEVCIL